MQPAMEPAGQVKLKIRRYRLSKTARPQLLTPLKCRYCTRRFFNTTRYNQHLRSHQRRYRKFWWKEKDLVEEDGDGIEETEEEVTVEEQLEDKDESAMESKGSDMRYLQKDKVFVYLVYPSGSLCECNKENAGSKPLCNCEYTYKQIVYSSIQQMHANLKSGIGYSCEQCKHHVVGRRSDSVSDDCSLVEENDSKNIDENDLKGVVIEVTEVSNGKWQCTECPSRFKSRDDQRLHMRIKHKPDVKVAGKTWKCLICNIVLPSRDRWKTHGLIHKAKGELEQNGVCKYCGVYFDTQEGYQTHMKEVHKKQESDETAPSSDKTDAIPKSECSKCGDCFGNEEDYNKHQQACSGYSNSSSTADPSSQTDSSTKAPQCAICGKQFTSLDKLEPHAKEHTKPIKKAGKKKRSKSKRILRQHHTNSKRRVHMLPAPNFPIITVCQVCKTAPCRCENAQGNPVTSFVPIAPKPQVKFVLMYQCMNCTLKFVSMSGLETHKKLCRGSEKSKRAQPAWKKATGRVVKKPWKSWRCDECLQVFKNRDDLRLHVRQKHKKGQLFRGKVWQCDICSEICSSRDKWKQHNNKAHKGEFKCEDCTLSFSKHVDLSTHRMKRHQTRQGRQDYVDVPFSAFEGQKSGTILDLSELSQAGEGYLLDKNLKEMMEAPPEDPEGKWNCTEGECSSRFKIRDDLKLHVRLKHKGGKVRGKIWQCQICKIALPTCDRWKRHGQIHKAEEDRGACKPCGIYFVSRADFDSHVRQFHENLIPDFLDEDSLDDSETGLLSLAYEGSKSSVYEEMDDSNLKEVFDEPRASASGKWKCAECLNRYLTRDDMKLHIRIKHRQGERNRGKTWQCRICNVALPSRDKWKTHGRNHRQGQVRACRDCGIYFDGDGNYVLHMVQVHRKNVKSLEEEEKGSIVNLESEGGNEWWPCSKCPRVSGSFAALKKHYNERHRESPIYVEESWSCFECASMFQTLMELRSHVTMFHTASAGKNWSCKVCAAVFQRSDDLQEHRKRSHEDATSSSAGASRWVCSECGEILTTRDELRLHRKGHVTTESQFKCIQCGWVFPDDESLQQHTQDHKIDFEHLKCLECDTDFPTHADLKTHVQTHFDMCQLCGLKFHQMQDREKHIKICALEGTRADSTQCPECGEKFEKTLQLRLHIANHAVKREQTRCKVCGVQFQRLKEMKQHKEKHKTDCLICGQKFSTIEQLNEHLDKHIACKHCNKTFESHNSLRRHVTTFCPVVLESRGKGAMRTKFPSIPLGSSMKRLQRPMIEEKCECFCDQCGRKFTTKGSLKQHRVIHFRKKFKNPTKCPDCDSTFLYATQLRLHQKKVHWPEKPFPCMYCRGKKRFRTNEELQRHELIHTAGKKYKCPMCTRRFGDSTGLKYHLNIHTGVKPYKCQYCPKTFNQPGQCKTHERLHEGKKPYKCHLCTCTYTYGMSLKIHLQTHVDRGELDKLPEIIHSEELQAQRKARNEAIKKSKRETVRQRRDDGKDIPYMSATDGMHNTHHNLQPQGQSQQDRTEEEQVFEAVAAAVMATEHNDSWNQPGASHQQPNQWHVSIGDPMVQHQHNVMQQRPMTHHPMHSQHRQVEESAAADALFNMIHMNKPN